MKNLRSTSKSFCIIFLSQDCFLCFVWLYWFVGLGKKSSEVKRHFHKIISGLYIINMSCHWWYWTWYHVLVMSVGFLHLNLFFFHLHTVCLEGTQYVLSTLKNWGIMVPPFDNRMVIYIIWNSSAQGMYLVSEVF